MSCAARSIKLLKCAACLTPECIATRPRSAMQTIVGGLAGAGEEGFITNAFDLLDKNPVVSA